MTHLDELIEKIDRGSISCCIEKDIIRSRRYNNIGSIYSRLIEDSGRFAVRYSSDVLIDIDTIEQSIKNNESKDFIIAVRDNGVDGNAFFESRMSNTESSRRHSLYRSLYVLRISCDTNTAKLFKIL